VPFNEVPEISFQKAPELVRLIVRFVETPKRAVRIPKIRKELFNQIPLPQFFIAFGILAADYKFL